MKSTLLSYSYKNSLLLLATVLLIISCSTQKDRFVNVAYHTINAKYNGYFNARESYEAGLKRLEEAHRDNYEEVLDIFKYGSEEDVSTIESYMDVAQEKSSVVIQRHSMNIDGEELNKWIDDAYFLIARSHYFKRDYNLAILTFQYIIRQYDTPLKYDSKIWIAKCNNALGRYNNSRQILDDLQSNYEEGLLPENTHRLFFMVYADYYYQQGRYEDAISYMEKAIENTRRRRDQTRLVFILGQTYQEIGDYVNAQNAYSRVLRLNPEFDMEFRAQINMAMSYDPEIGGGDEIRAELKDMLDQGRNRPYRDQIYYALAKLSESENMTDEAIHYYLKSTEVSEDNDIQKGLSFLQLGEIYYDREEFYESHIYYENAANYLPSDYENIDKIVAKSNILNDLAMNIELINMEDSLQHLASLPESERNRIVEDIIEEQRKKDRREQEMGRMAGGRERGMDRQPGMPGGERGGWYFYNSSAISFGQTEFASRWGNRELEDLWRLSNTQTYSPGDLAVGDVEEPEGQIGEQEQYDMQAYLDNLPLKPEQLKASNERLIQAYYNKALIYKDQLNNSNKAIEAFETLIDRFPDNEHQLNAYYFLHDINSRKGNQVKANEYKNKIVDKYPGSDFAMILSDPDYAENVRQREYEGNKLYKQAFFAYNNKDYDKVISFCKKSNDIELSKELAGKFAYLKALAYGSKGSKDDLIEKLTHVVNNYEGTEVFKPANNMLAFFSDPDSSQHRAGDLPDKEEGTLSKKEESGEHTGKEKTKTPGEFKSIYEYDPDAIHFFVFIVDSDKIDIQQLRSKVNDFNRNAYPDENLTLSNIYLAEKKQILTVTNFENSEKAMDYRNNISDNENIAGLDEKHLESFVISVKNYPVFYQEKNVDDYKAFFNHYY